MLETHRTIWKYPIGWVQRQIIQVPAGFNLLSFQKQYDTPTLWFEVDKDTVNVDVIVELVGTGQMFDTEGKDYGGTIQNADGRLVLHMYYGIVGPTGKVKVNE